jgi:hypothetical protein
MIFTSVVGHSNGSKLDGIHKRCPAQMVLGIWIGTNFEEKLNKVKVGHSGRVTCSVQGRIAVWKSDSVDVGAVFDKLSPQYELVFLD